MQMQTQGWLAEKLRDEAADASLFLNVPDVATDAHRYVRLLNQWATVLEDEVR